MSDKKFRFQSLTIYVRSLELANKIYDITKNWPREYLFDLTSQIRRAALSIPLNIAEGSAKTKNEFKHFLTISRGSCFELIPLLEIALKQNLINENMKNKIGEEIYQLSKMISSLKSSLK